MKYNKKSIGKYNNDSVIKYTIKNNNGVKFSALSLGATLYEFSTSNGTNMIANYSTLEEYVKSPFCLCMTIGRVGGRIKDGIFSIDENTYQVDTNENGNTLHGGPNSFKNINWKGEFEEDRLIFSAKICKNYDSFPGNLDAKIIYSLDNDNTLTITFLGISDQDTLFNPMNHTYFNLGDKASILNEQLKIDSDFHLQLNDEKIPTGKLLLNDDSAFDFLKSKSIGLALRELKKENNKKEFDDTFVLNQHNLKQTVVELFNPKNNYGVQIFNDRNGIVLFTANPYLDNKSQIPNSIALESQTLPDAINHNNFGNIILKKDTIQKYVTKYRIFSKKM